MNYNVSKNAVDFAIACLDMNSIEELEDCDGVNRIDCNTWGITIGEWHWAVKTALEAKKNGGSINENGSIVV